ncbi:uncharacterized protein LOC125240550 isoform X2 [Leguminivora glycinivorella]|uniref:uncharacterized protein LOC125240550 isoform X2 n=1 Tax=Leguminivora glycinivorella TaxID=1035111 RepID=UPI00200DFF70|nr:uncharacterized protein LOC125240550 isoform X2 [Leguminivora glycinivorella]
MFRISTQQTLKASMNVEPRNCDSVCRDLPPGDTQPVCMMASRYKKGYLYFANHCQARLAMCIENFVLNMVHWRRCQRYGLHLMPNPSYVYTAKYE